MKTIDREYNGLEDRGTWTYVIRTSDMNVISITWVFRPRPLDWTGQTVIHTTRCCLRGDFQIAEVDQDPSETYAPVACHEAVRILFSHAAKDDLISEGRDWVMCTFTVESTAKSLSNSSQGQAELKNARTCLSTSQLSIWDQTSWPNLGLSTSWDTSTMGIQKVRHGRRRTIQVHKVTIHHTVHCSRQPRLHIYYWSDPKCLQKKAGAEVRRKVVRRG